MKYFKSRLSVAIVLTLSMFSTSFAGPPFKTDDPQPVGLRHWEFYLASVQQFERSNSTATLPHFEINYGLLPHVQIHLVAPLGYAHLDQETHYGYSDTEIGVKYRFLEETESAPQVGVFPLVEIPTGNADKGLGSGELQAYLPIWIQKSWGKFTTYAGGGFWYNPGQDGQKNWLFSGWEAQYDFSETVTFGGELYYQTADSEDAFSSAGFNLGGYVNVDESDHILFSVGHTFSGEPATTGYVAYQLTI